MLKSNIKSRCQYFLHISGIFVYHSVLTCYMTFLFYVISVGTLRDMVSVHGPKSPELFK
jgi:hypothetical protein